MPGPTTITDPAEEQPPPAQGAKARGPGRPPGTGRASASRASILRAAYKLARAVPLQDISVVMVAREIDVTPALVHYYIGGRDWLTSGVMNLFYRDLLRKLPAPTDDWRQNIVATAKATYEHFVAYGGIAAYAVSHSRFRVYQLTAFGDRDYGVEVLEAFTGSVRSAGRSEERTGIYAHLLMEFVINSAHATVRHMYPGDFKQFLEEKTDRLDPLKYPNIFFARRAPLTLDAQVAFDEGFRLFLLGIESEPVAVEGAAAPPAKKPSTKSKRPQA